MAPLFVKTDPQQTLTALFRVPGVKGSMLVGPGGELPAWNMPPLGDEGTLEEVGVKLTRVREAFRKADEELDFSVIRFGEYRLCLKAGDAGLLCVLTRPDVNLSALRMAAKLVLQRIAQPSTA